MKFGTKIFLIVMIIVLLGVGGFFTYRYYNMQDGDESGNETPVKVNSNTDYNYDVFTYFASIDKGIGDELSDLYDFSDESISKLEAFLLREQNEINVNRYPDFAKDFTCRVCTPFVASPLAITEAMESLETVVFFFVYVEEKRILLIVEE